MNIRFTVILSLVLVVLSAGQAISAAVESNQMSQESTLKLLERAFPDAADISTSDESPLSYVVQHPTGRKEMIVVYFATEVKHAYSTYAVAMIIFKQQQAEMLKRFRSGSKIGKKSNKNFLLICQKKNGGWQVNRKIFDESESGGEGFELEVGDFSGRGAAEAKVCYGSAYLGENVWEGKDGLYLYDLSTGRLLFKTLIKELRLTTDSRSIPRKTNVQFKDVDKDGIFEIVCKDESTGAVRVYHLREGQYKLASSEPANDSDIKKKEPKEEKIIRGNVRLVLNGKVLGENGRPLIGAEVQGWITALNFLTGRTSRKEFTKLTDKEGKFKIRGKGVLMEFFISHDGYYDKDFYFEAEKWPEGIFEVRLSRKGKQYDMIKDFVRFKEALDTCSWGYDFDKKKKVMERQNADIWFEIKGLEDKDGKKRIIISTDQTGGLVLGPDKPEPGAKIEDCMLRAPEEGYSAREYELGKKLPEAFYIKFNKGTRYGKIWTFLAEELKSRKGIYILVHFDYSVHARPYNTTSLERK